MVKGCKGCETGSPRQAEHNHFVVDSEEYEEGKKFAFIFLIIIVVVWFVIWLVRR